MYLSCWANLFCLEVSMMDGLWYVCKHVITSLSRIPPSHGSQSKRGRFGYMNCLVDLCPSRWWCWNDHSHTVHVINRCDVWNLIEKRGILHVNCCRISSICCNMLWFRSPAISTVLPWRMKADIQCWSRFFPRHFKQTSHHRKLAFGIKWRLGCHVNQPC